ncbi:MAG TPA: hypothetical protein VFP98_08070 [Candidatus Polarisedimenticolia bacterium]|nr:hypothetical protein [Candidatus Polarisedimenticolia bacterium]
MKHHLARISILLVPICFGPAGYAGAAGPEVRWYVGGSVSFHSTDDVVENNAAGPADPRMPRDPRPDRFESREATIEDTFQLDLTLGFAAGSRLSFQMDVGYFRGQVGPIDAYLSEKFPKASNPSVPTLLNIFAERQTTIQVTAGELTQIPVSLSGIVHFRRDRPFNPYAGLGIGMIYTEFGKDPDVTSFNGRLDRLRIRAIRDERGNDLVPKRFNIPGIRGLGRLPQLYPIELDSGDAFESHALAGVRYLVNERFSVFADVRYTRTNGEIAFELAGEDQVTFVAYPATMFRPDGSLRIFNQAGGLPNTPIDPNDPSGPTVTCTPGTTGDFDNDGRGGDLCYTPTDIPEASLLVQGGRINLSGFTARIGVRFYF